MAPSKQLQHRRTHNLILISKLLSCRENASPFTLILDSLEQSAKPLVNEMIRRAVLSKVHISYISFSTLRKPKDVDDFIQASTMTIPQIQKRLEDIASRKQQVARRSLIIIDTLHPLLASPNLNIPALLSSLITPTISLLLTYHVDISLPFTLNSLSTPHPLTTLRYLATTLIHVHSLHHVLAQKAARERSHAEPIFGLQEETEGVVVGLGANDMRGVVLEMEYRRKSGRGVREWFFLPSNSASPSSSTSSIAGPRRPTATTKETVILLEDHPLHAGPKEDATKHDEEDAETTFNLGITEKQRRDREGIVLPYFDAQKDGGTGEGGRILYDMGEEDDFDEEEDEI